jgi:hypothetical protein
MIRQSVNNELERIQKCPKPNMMCKPKVSLQEMRNNNYNKTQQDGQSLQQDLYHPNIKNYHHPTDHGVLSPNNYPTTKQRFMIRDFLAALYTTTGPHVAF